MTSPWRWLPKAKRYQNTKTGRFIGPKQMEVLRDTFVQAQYAKMEALVDRMDRQQITRREWVTASRDVIRGTLVDLYALGKGGRGAMTQADYGRVGAMAKYHYQKLQGFEADVRDGKLTLSRAKYRAKQYITAVKQAFERGRVASYGIPGLPAMPGEGSECLYNCKCKWRIVETDTEWLCYWELSTVEHCPTCARRGQMWNPYRIPKTMARFAAAPGEVLWAGMV